MTKAACFFIFALLIFSVIQCNYARPYYVTRDSKPRTRGYGGYYGGSVGNSGSAGNVGHYGGYGGYGRYGGYGLRNKMPRKLDENIPRDEGIFEKLNLQRDANEARENIPDLD